MRICIAQIEAILPPCVIPFGKTEGLLIYDTQTKSIDIQRG